MAQPYNSGVWNGDLQRWDYTHGRVFVYTRSVDGIWTDEPQVLIASDYADGDSFGDAVAISGNHILIGASEINACPLLEDDGTCSQRGKAYIFKYNGGTWEQEGDPLHPDEDATDPRFHFGAYVALDGDTALIGHDSESGGGTWDDDSQQTIWSNLIVYGFTRGSGNIWEQSIKLIPPSSDRTLYPHDFGKGVQLVGNRALIEGEGRKAVLFENWEYVNSEGAFGYPEGYWNFQRSNRLALNANSIFLASSIYNHTIRFSDKGSVNVIDNFSVLPVSSFGYLQNIVNEFLCLLFNFA